MQDGISSAIPVVIFLLSVYVIRVLTVANEHRNTAYPAAAIVEDVECWFLRYTRFQLLTLKDGLQHVSKEGRSVYARSRFLIGWNPLNALRFHLLGNRELVIASVVDGTVSWARHNLLQIPGMMFSCP